MKTLISLVVVFSYFSNHAHAQVLEPAWLYGKILQKGLSTKTPTCATSGSTNLSRNLASSDGLQIRREDGWKLVENNPPTIKNRTLLLPGFLGTDYVYHDMLRDPEMEKQGIKMIAGNAPGFYGLKVPPGFDFSIQSYADLVEKIAEKEKIDTLVGHSYMATVLGEVAKRGRFKGKIVMMSPALNSDDEPLSTRALNLITHDPVMKDVAWTGMYSYMDEAFTDFFKPGDRHLKTAADEAVKTPIPYAQQMLKQYFNYLNSEENSFVKDIKKTPAQIHYINGGKDVVDLKPENKALLKASGKVTFHHYPNASHMVMLDEAKSINKLLLSLSSTK